MSESRELKDAVEAGQRLQRVAVEVGKAIEGKQAAIRLALCAIVGGGHLLIEDLPGVGKTTLAQALSRALGLDFARVQFTSDLLPSDVIGAQIFDPREASFSFRPGPVFAQVVLADEINRAPPRTQSALLEAMSERQVSVDGVSHPLPRPFIVLATQNPIDQSGTYPLPDSQLDRFLLRLSLGYPPPHVERALVASRDATVSVLDRVQPALDAASLIAIQRMAQRVRVESSLADYLARITEATRQTRLLSVGASTRGLLALASAAKAHALVDGRDFLLPDDVRAVSVATLAHRVLLASGPIDGLAARAESERVIESLLERVELPE